MEEKRGEGSGEAGGGRNDCGAGFGIDSRKRG